MNQGVGDERRDAWSRYWASGRLHSCAGSFDGNYGGAIGDFWRALFRALPGTSRVLDLATGNGALPALSWEVRGADVVIDAIDLADLAPDWYDGDVHRTVRFHPGVRMESLPFERVSFDCVVSQFGMEYADRRLVLDEIMRISRPDSTIALMMHHTGSVLARVAREESSHHATLLGEDGLVAAAMEVAPWIARLRSGQDVGRDGAALLARDRYNHAMRDVGNAASSSFAPDLLVEVRDHVHALLAGMDPGRAGRVVEQLQAHAAALAAARLRAQELVEHAVDPAQLDEMVGHIARSRPSARVETMEVRQAEGVLAWLLVVNRPAQLPWPKASGER